MPQFLDFLDWKVWGPADARLGPAPDPTPPPGARPITPDDPQPGLPILSPPSFSHIYLYIYTYIYTKGFIPHPPRSILSKPLLRGAYVTTHPLQTHPLHTL
ncbi:hypothetical protein Hanom_Chr16g01439391 [Helianthus anomalus]